MSGVFNFRAVSLALALCLGAFAVSQSHATEVHLALKEGRFTEAEGMIRRGFAINSRGPQGDTALHWVAFHGHEDLTRLLLEIGAEVDIQVRNGNTPLHLAAYAGQMHTAALLLKAQANVAARNFEGLTPLHWAARNGHTEMARLLLEHDADTAATDVHGRTPLELAGLEQRDEVYELLRDQADSAIVPGGANTGNLGGIRHSGTLSRAAVAVELDELATEAEAVGEPRKIRRPSQPRTPGIDMGTSVAAGSKVARPPVEPDEPAQLVKPALPAEPSPPAAKQERRAWVQLAATKGEQSARRIARELAETHLELLGDTDVAVILGHTAGGTPVYRVRAGPMAKSHARATCEELKSRKQDCFVAIARP